MNYVNVSDELPRANVSVWVQTGKRTRSIARYQPDTRRWVTNDKSLSIHATILKWKYQDAIPNRSGA